MSRAGDLLPPPAIAFVLRRDLHNRATYQRLLQRLVTLDRFTPAYYRLVLDIERQISGVFAATEIDHGAQALAERRVVMARGKLMTISASVPVGRFSDLPSSPRLTRETVVLASAGLDGRLLVLEGVVTVPDQELASAIHYSRANVRKAINETLRAIGLGGAQLPRYPARSAPTGSTHHERLEHHKGRRKAAQRQSARARARSAPRVAAERDRLEAGVAAGRLHRWTQEDFDRLAQDPNDAGVSVESRRWYDFGPLDEANGVYTSPYVSALDVLALFARLGALRERTARLQEVPEETS